MKPSETSHFEEQTKTVFDRSRIGEHVSAERHDEPGDENLSASGRHTDETGPTRKVSLLQSALATDFSGDWSWKPGRSSVGTPTLQYIPHLRYCNTCDSTYCICRP